MIHRQIQLFSNKLEKKDKLWSLRELLNQNIATPQRIINENMFPQNSIKRVIKTSNNSTRIQVLKKEDIKLSTNIQLSTCIKPTIGIKFKQYRSKSCIKPRNENMIIKQRLLLVQRKNSVPIFRNVIKQNLISRQLTRSPSIQGFSLQRSYKSQQIFKDMNNKYSTFNVARNEKYNNKKLQIRRCQNNQYNEPYIEQLKYQKIDSYLTRSLQARKRNEPFQKSQYGSNMNQQLYKLNKQLPFNCKKNYLKKGASLQKQIVVSLLRHKMIKQSQNEIQKKFSVNEIKNMIKLYKGFGKVNNKQQQLQKQYQDLNNEDIQEYRFYENKPLNYKCPINIVQKFKKSVDRWQIDQQYEVQINKKQNIQQHITDFNLNLSKISNQQQYNHQQQKNHLQKTKHQQQQNYQ